MHHNYFCHTSRFVVNALYWHIYYNEVIVNDYYSGISREGTQHGYFPLSVIYMLQKEILDCALKWATFAARQWNVFTMQFDCLILSILLIRYKIHIYNKNAEKHRL